MRFIGTIPSAPNRIFALSLCAIVLANAIPLHGEDAWKDQIRPFLRKHCTDCHGGDEPEAELDLAVFGKQNPIPASRETWVNVLEMLQGGHMPPEEASQPSVDERQTVTEMLSDALLSLDGIRDQDPGHVTLRRLNRTEYHNVIVDLFGFDINPTQDFPADDTGYGFDNIGDVLSLSPVLFEKYLAAAEKITDRVIDGAENDAERARNLFVCIPGAGDDWKACARRILEPVARRAFRRPVLDDELNRLLEFVVLAQSEGESFEQGIQIALQAILVSPNFLFHVVQDPPTKNADAIVPLSNFELASRLSFFLWSRGPDDELFEMAEQGKLHDENVLAEQVRRMLAHDHASSLAKNFASQWLQLARLDTIAPDPDLYPDFDEELRRASREESEQFFTSVLREDRSLLTLLDADFSFLNERLARHYGIAGVSGPEFRRVRFENGRRGGLVGQASILTITSNPTRTSPVKRGKWILEEILGTPPLPPPPDVEDLSENAEEVASASLRVRLEKHRSQEICASCHRNMDPLGFALENYNAIGAWREQDGKFPINAAGTLPDGTFFDGPIGLKTALLERKRDFVQCLAEKMLTYALGRGVEYYDRSAMEGIVAAVEKNDYRMSRLVLEIIRSVPFQMKRQQQRSS
ncbi:MAG: DUF1592 domain-containing protein [Pirellulales bacterium]